MENATIFQGISPVAVLVRESRWQASASEASEDRGAFDGKSWWKYGEIPPFDGEVNMELSINWGIQLIVGSQWKIPLKWMMWGYPYVRKPPYVAMGRPFNETEKTSLWLFSWNISCPLQVFSWNLRGPKDRNRSVPKMGKAKQRCVKPSQANVNQAPSHLENVKISLPLGIFQRSHQPTEVG